MADLNVFQLTNEELHKTEKTEAPAKNTGKVVKESVSKRRTSKRRRPFSIPVSKIKTESLHRFLEDGDEEVTVDYTPEDDVVLVVDPEMDEVPEDTEEAKEQAEQLVGDHVCKCSICGANYVTDAEISEDLEVEDEQCPVCGETGEQIVVGVITPTEELSDEDKEDIEGDEVAVDEEEVSDEDGDFEFEEEEVEESLRRPCRPTARRRVESRMPKRPMARKPMARRTSKTVSEDYSFDETTLNRMLTTFAKENYENVKSVRISKGKINRGVMTLEGVVTTTKGSRRPIKLVSESFKMDKKMTIRFKEYGPFTESVKTSRPAFIIECVVRSNTVIPVVMKYSFKAKDAGLKKESRATYSVTGRVLSESVRKPMAKRPVSRRPRTKK